MSELAEDIDNTILVATGGSHVLNRNWFAGSDQWFFSDRPLSTLEDFEGLQIRSHAAALSDFLRGMGAEPEFLGPAEIYNALERGFVDAVTTSPLLALSDRLSEVAGYMSGPIIGFGYTNNVTNKDVWGRIPADLQQILIEEGAKAELEALRIALYHNIIAVQINQTLGVQPVPFPEETVRHIQGVIFPQYVLPGWLDRLGFPGKSEDVVDAFNEKVSPYLGYKVAADGSLEEVPITKGPRAGQ